MSQESTLQKLKEKRISCPHCGHHLHLTLDASAGDQDYYEECPSCCKEIHFYNYLIDPILQGPERRNLNLDFQVGNLN